MTDIALNYENQSGRLGFDCELEGGDLKTEPGIQSARLMLSRSMAMPPSVISLNHNPGWYCKVLLHVILLSPI